MDAAFANGVRGVFERQFHGPCQVTLPVEQNTTDFERWNDHGPILVGVADGYEPRLAGGHVQGQLESSNLLYRNDRWFLLVQEKRRNSAVKNWSSRSDC